MKRVIGGKEEYKKKIANHKDISLQKFERIAIFTGRILKEKEKNIIV